MDGNKIKVPSGSHRQTQWNKEKSKKISIFKALYDFVLDL